MSAEASPTLRLIHGDCLIEVPKLEPGSVNLVFADPPYFLSSGTFTVRSGRAVSVDKGAWDHLTREKSNLDFQREWIETVKKVMHPDGALVLSGTYHSIFECGVALKESGFRILNDIIWFKPNGAPNLSGRRLAASHETLIWASLSSKSRFTFNYEDLKHGSYPEDKLKAHDKQMRSVWSIPTTPKLEKEFGSHPTQKPIALMRRVVEAFSRPGEVVLDPFMGSGTTGVACQILGRSFIGVELEKEFVNLASKRLGVEVD